jgi:hypothetical protein
VGAVGMPGILPELTFGALNFGSAGKFGRAFRVFPGRAKPAGRRPTEPGRTRGSASAGSARETFKDFAALFRLAAVLETVCAVRRLRRPAPNKS